MRTFGSVIIWIYWGICFILFFILVTLAFVLLLPFDRFRRIPNRILKGLAFCMIQANPGWSVSIEGIDNYTAGRPTIFVANHQSFLDMPLAYLLPWTMKWVSKKSLFYIPFLGWITWMTGHLGIDRRSLSSVKLLDKLVEPIQAGIPAMFFPEGTRTSAGELRRFKNGAFTLARQYNFRIQPLVLEGGHRAMPAGSWKLHFRQRFYIRILEPVDPQQFDTVEELRDYVRKQIARKLESLRSDKRHSTA